MKEIISEQCKACKNLFCELEKMSENQNNECEDFDCKDWFCEECFEPIHRDGFRLWCENGCFEDDIRNGIPEDELEEYGIQAKDYPKDESLEDFRELEE